MFDEMRRDEAEACLDKLETQYEDTSNSFTTFHRSTTDGSLVPDASEVEETMNLDTIQIFIRDDHFNYVDECFEHGIVFLSFSYDRRDSTPAHKIHFTSANMFRDVYVVFENVTLSCLNDVTRISKDSYSIVTKTQIPTLDTQVLESLTISSQNHEINGHNSIVSGKFRDVVNRRKQSECGHSGKWK